MKELADIQATLSDRKRTGMAHKAGMELVIRTYNGDLDLPLPELDEQESPAVPNLVQIGIDQTAMRVTSVQPTITFAPTRPGIKTEQDRARLRRNVLTGWWANNHIVAKDRRRARQLVGLAYAPVSLMPDADGLPLWRLREPLGTWPADMLDPDDMVPPNCIYTFKRSSAWVKANYPALGPSLNQKEASFEIVEYNDIDETVCYLVNPTDNVFVGPQPPLLHELHRVENRTDTPWNVIPNRITLDKPLGQFDASVDIYRTEAKLMALFILGVQRGIFGEQWIYSTNGEASVDVQADAKDGVIGRITNGQIVTVGSQISPYAQQAIDRLEGAARSAGVPAEFSGLSASNVRTGKRGDAVLGAAIDFRIQEAQDILAQAHEHENKIAIAIAKAYGGNRQFSMYVPGIGKVAYKPAELFDTDVHQVMYAYSGADANSLPIIVGQRIGIGTMSKRRAMEIDPLILDAETEHDCIIGEQVEQAFLSSIQTMAANPDAPWQPNDFARFTELVMSDKLEPYAAAQQIHDEKQKEQAAAAAAQGPPGPEGMPGLATPGAPGSPDQFASIQPAPASLDNLSTKLMQMRGMQRQPQPIPQGA